MTRTHTPHSNRLLAAFVAVAALVLLAAFNPASALATATVSGNDENSGTPLSSDKLDFIDYDNEGNNLTVTYDDAGTPNWKDDDTATFHDPAVQVEKYVANIGYSNAFTQCFEDDPHTVHCQADNVNEIRVWTFDGNDVVHVTGDPIHTTVYAGDGIDTLYGGPGVDDLNAGPGNDWVFGGGGDDTLDGDANDDWVVGDAGNDTVRGDAGNDKLDGDLGADTLWGGSGTDTADYHYYTSKVTVDLDNVADDGKANEGDNVRSDVENVLGGTVGDDITGNGADNIIKGNGGPDDLHGGAGEDVIFGGSNADTIYGDANNDDLRGESGDDTMFGGSGDDTLLGGAGADYTSGGIGTKDTAEYWDRTNQVVADNDGQPNDDGEAGEGDTITTTTEQIVGGDGPDILTGKAAVNGLYGGDGDDQLNSNNGVADTDDCGSGNNDFVDADGLDTVTNCESKPQQPAQAQPQADPQAQQSQQQPAGPKVSIYSTGKLKSKKARLTLKCPKTAKGHCNGKLTLKRGGKTVGSKKFDLKAGKKITLKVALSKKARKAFVSASKRKFDAKAVTHDDVSVDKTTTAKVTIKLQKS